MINWPALEFPPINLWSVWKEDMTDSPCQKKCDYDTVKGICRGCGRSMEEIINWKEYTDDERFYHATKARLRLKRYESIRNY